MIEVGELFDVEFHTGERAGTRVALSLAAPVREYRGFIMLPIYRHEFERMPCFSPESVESIGPTKATIYYLDMQFPNLDVRCPMYASWDELESLLAAEIDRLYASAQ